ncbi:MAG: lysylphosphatidylglycerol synthase transmembrane domain-containing protein [Acidimicrobiales bacterium]
MVPSRRSIWLVARATAFVVLAYIGVQVVLANSAELSGAATYLRHLNWAWIGAAVVVEAISYVNFTLLQRRLLASGGLAIGLVPLAAMSLAGGAISNSLPGGGAFATVFAYRQFRHRGADEALTTWTIMAFTALTALALAILAVAGLVIAGEDGGVGGLWLLVGLLVVGPTIGVVVLLRPRLLAPCLKPPVRLVRRLTRFPRSPSDAFVDDLVARIGAVTPRPIDWLAGLAFAGGNWLFDCACLVCAFGAVRTGVPWRGVLLAYGAAQVVSNVPITPGGLGVVEGSLTVALVAFGGSTSATVAAVLLYRVISFWLTMPLGWLAWFLLQLDVRRHPRPEPDRGLARAAAS